LSHEKFLLMMLEKPLSHIDLGGGIRGWLDAYVDPAANLDIDGHKKTV
jgi:hypothetical protein